MDDVRETIRQFILSTYLQGESPENLRDRTPLQTSGIVDSLGLLGLVGFIEQRYGVELNVHETSADRFDRIDDIVTVIARKREARAQRSDASQS